MTIKQYTAKNISWCSPLEMAENITDPYFALLYSAVKTSYSGRHSLLAYGLSEKLESDDFEEFAGKLSDNGEKFSNAWFGYLAYDLKNTLEKLTHDKDDWLTLPNLVMLQFKNILLFDHEQQSIVHYSANGHPLPAGAPKNYALPKAKITGSNMGKGEYLGKVQNIIDHIHAGDLYQANLTRKFYGEFAEIPNYFQLFKKLCAASPAPFSAFLRLGEHSVISSSPELFMELDASGTITTRPIKGTAPRGADAKTDSENKNALALSEKDRAENLMIVDLMRNDLARCGVPGSVRTESLFDITTHATIHHMSSTISGKKSAGCSGLQAVQALFPPGSMTGAPKISAMELCSKLESEKRGIYSGAVGWFGGDGSCHLSVVIRTIIGCGKKFEFQVGGGIVADSTPSNELAEHISKARGIMLALDVPVTELDIL